jgi:arsenite methyltransferase
MELGLSMESSSEKPDYGIDAPGVVMILFGLGVGLCLLAWFVPVIHLGPIIWGVRPTCYLTAPLLFAESILMVVYAKFGKFHHRDRMLAMVGWKGGETVLDVGTGRGLLLIGAAKKLTTGKSTGIDIWSSKDLSGNSMQGTLHNADLEGVRDRVEVLDGDATHMSFPEASFDVVLSNLCIHNIPHKADRDKACREIVRVLKPGGVGLISDFKHTADYTAAFLAAGAQAVRAGANWWATFPPLRIVRVEKPRT